MLRWPKSLRQLRETRRRNRNENASCGCLSLLLLGMMLLLAMSCQTAFADNLDNLYLTGIIKNVNPVTGVAYVEVLSSSCRGMRTFRADDPEGLQYQVRRKVSFFIDSDTCKDTAVHTILVSRGLNR